MSSYARTISTIINLIIIRVTKSRKMQWMGHVTGMGDERNKYKILV
jgi:hypothetical protein